MTLGGGGRTGVRGGVVGTVFRGGSPCEVLPPPPPAVLPPPLAFSGGMRIFLGNEGKRRQKPEPRLDLDSQTTFSQTSATTRFSTWPSLRGKIALTTTTKGDQTTLVVIFFFPYNPPTPAYPDQPPARPTPKS